MLLLHCFCLSCFDSQLYMNVPTYLLAQSVHGPQFTTPFLNGIIIVIHYSNMLQMLSNPTRVVANKTKNKCSMKIYLLTFSRIPQLSGKAPVPYLLTISAMESIQSIFTKFWTFILFWPNLKTRTTKIFRPGQVLFYS